MDKYLKALDEYVSFKIKYANIDLENDLNYRKQFHELGYIKDKMETQLAILIKR